MRHRICKLLPQTSPEEVADLAQTYDLGAAKPYFEGYIPPNNADRPVNVAVIELLNVREASLPSEVTPRRVMNGWVSNFDVDPPKIREDEITPLDSVEARAFLDAARGDRYEALYVIALMTGLRMGETLGLRWSDIDLDAGTLRVNRQLQRMRREGDKPGKLEFSEPKNASRRTVALPHRAVEALRSHRKRQDEELLRATDYVDSGLVLATAKGTPLDAQNVVNQHFKPMLVGAGLPTIRWHDLRYSYVTLLLRQVTRPT